MDALDFELMMMDLNHSLVSAEFYLSQVRRSLNGKYVHNVYSSEHIERLTIVQDNMDSIISMTKDLEAAKKTYPSGYGDYLTTLAEAK